MCGIVGYTGPREAGPILTALLEDTSEIDLGAQLGREHLRHDLSAKLRVAAEEDARHPAAVQLPFDGIARSERSRGVEDGVHASDCGRRAKERQRVEPFRRVIVRVHRT